MNKSYIRLIAMTLFFEGGGLGGGKLGGGRLGVGGLGGGGRVTFILRHVFL